MRLRNLRWSASVAGAALVALALFFGPGGCVLEQAQPPDLTGPADVGVSVDLAALPDTLNADGVSASVVRLVLRDQKGAPIRNLSVQFVLEAGDGTIDPAKGAIYVGPIQTGHVMATDSTGTTSVVYTAGTAFTTVRIGVRPYGIDAASAFYRSVEILQQ